MATMEDSHEDNGMEPYSSIMDESEDEDSTSPSMSSDEDDDEDEDEEEDEDDDATHFKDEEDVHFKEEGDGHFRGDGDVHFKEEDEAHFKDEDEGIDTGVSSISYEKSFECPNCGKTFAYRKRFIDHMDKCAQKSNKNTKKVNKPEKKTQPTIVEDDDDVYYECALCEMQFKKKFDFNLHMTSHSDSPHQCKICGRKFNKKEYLLRHIHTHSDEKIYSCAVCGYKVSRPDRYKLHMQSHGITDPFKCSLCGDGFSGLKLLNLHLNSHNSSALDPRPNGLSMFTCNECSFTFDRPEKYKSHMFQKHGVKAPYECSLCGDSFTSKLHLNKHLSNHNYNLQSSVSDADNRDDSVRDDETQDSVHLSSAISKTPSGDSMSNGVVKVHHRNSTLLSQRHDQARTSSNELEDDAVEEERNGSFRSECSDVAQQSDKDTGSGYEATASDSDNDDSQPSHYACKPCAVRFSNIKEQLTHLKKFHNKKFGCFSCGRAYTRKSNLNKHGCIDKRMIKSWKCTTCGISFPSSKELDDHLITHVSEVAGSSHAIKKEAADSDSQLSPEMPSHSHKDPSTCQSTVKKKKKTNHKPSHGKLKKYNNGRDIQIGLGEEEEEVEEEEFFLFSEMCNYDKSYPKKKVKRKIPSGSSLGSDSESKVSKKKGKIKSLSTKLSGTNNSNNEGSKKKQKKPLTALQVIDMIESEVAKVKDKISIPFFNRVEQERSALEYERLVVYEFMSMNPMLPKQNDSFSDSGLGDMKISEQLCMKFFM